MREQEESDKENPPPFDLDRCAELAAVLHYFKRASRTEVLERLQVEPDEYQRSSRHWLAAMAAEVESAEDDIATQYSGSFSRKRDELAESRPALESLGPRRVVVEVAESKPGEPEAAEGNTEPVVPSGAAPGRPVLAVLGGAPPPANVPARPMPSYLAAPVRPQGVPSQPQGFQSVAHVGPSAPTPPPMPLPMRVAPAPPPLIPASTAPSSTGPDSTGELDQLRLKEGLFQRGIPFAQNAGATPPPPSPAVPVHQSGETVLADARELHAKLEARGVRVAAENPPSGAGGDSTVLARMKQAFGQSQPGETKLVDPGAIAQPLPFRGVPAVPQKPAAPPAIVAASLPPLPPGWNIARYAVLCIDLHVSGMSEDTVLAVAQLTRPQRAALDDYWQQRMMHDPALRNEWQRHADRRSAELRAKRG